MQRSTADQLLDEVRSALAQNLESQFAVVGHTAVAYEVVELFRRAGAEHRLLGIYAEVKPDEAGIVKPLDRLRTDSPNTVVVADDGEKERLLCAAEPYLLPTVSVIISGYEHLRFRHPIFEGVLANALVPSLANGYPNSLIHLFQCLENASRLNLRGVVAEFGVFKGGTTMILSRFIQRLGKDWPVIGFDTFAGFPPKRSLFDMYEHPDCVFSDEQSVRQYLSVRNVELVKGDLAETIARLSEEDIVVAFFDTDNFSSTNAALDVIQDRVVPGGALVFDHFTGSNRFKYTLGERLAAKRLLADPRFFHLHDTGVFLRQGQP